MSVNIESILNNMTNENIEINCRAMQSLHNKIINNLISLEQLNEITCDKCLISFGNWFSMFLNYREQNRYEDDFLIKSLIDFSQCLNLFPMSSIKNLKNTMKISNLINDIGSVSNNYREICDQILQLLAKPSLSMPNDNIIQNQINPHANNLTNSNSGSVSLTYSITRQEENQSMLLKGSNSRISKIHDSSEHNNSASLNHQSTFNKCIVTSHEEQMVFDLGINLKFGDALQLYKSFYILYSQVLNDFPIEYILRNEEMLRAFLNILVQCNFLEFGVICYKILDKLFLLLEKKITLCLNDSHSLKTLKPRNISIDETCLCTIESFLYNSITSLTKAVLDVNKLAFYVSLLEKNYFLIQKLLLNNNINNWKEILYDILFNLDQVTNHYKSKGLSPNNFFDFCLRLYSNIPDQLLIEFLLMNDNIEVPPLQFIKNMFFTVSQNTITLHLMEKLERIKSSDESIESMIVDYNNANMINKSISLTKQMFNPQSHFDPNTVIDNFYNVLLAIKYLNNNSQDEEYEKLFLSNQFPLIKIICEYYQKDTMTNKQKASDLLTKLLLFKKSEKIDSGLSIYNSILDELKVKKEGVFELFLSQDFISIILTDLTITEYESIILDILFELYSNNDIAIQSDSQIRKLFILLPSFGNNFKFTSLQSKLDSTLNYEEIMTKYLRCLFSKNENVRYNAINFFVKNDQGSLSDESFMKKNYSEFKQVDTLLLIQTATNEYIKVNKAIQTGGGLGTMEFMPLLNIIYSNKMDYNIKSSALEQLVLLSNTPCYKNYFLNDILSFIIKEIKANENNISNFNMGNYLTALLKLFNIIIITYYKEDKIQPLLSFPSVKDYLHIIINISLGKDNNTLKHLMAAYALLFLFIYAFNDKTHQSSNSLIPIPKFFDSYYFINLIPCEMIPLKTSQHSSVLNFSITKNVIDYINYQKKPLAHIFNLQEIKDNIKQIKALSLLDIFINITHLLSAYSVYSNTIDINESLIQILFYFKRIVPKTNEERHLIMDFLSVFDIFLNSNMLQTTTSLSSAGFDQVIVYIPDILHNCINYTCIDKDFINNLNGENQYFVYEILEFIIRNRLFLPVKRFDLISTFIEIYSNVLVFSQEGSFYQLKNNLIKFQSLLVNSVALPEKLYTDIINTICFFLTKYEVGGNYLNLNYTTWTLNYLIQMVKMNKGREILLSKSFIFVKLLGAPFIEINILSIQIIGMIFSLDFFDKHGTIITDVYESIKKLGNHPQSKVIKTNYLNFLIKSIEFILKNKSIDNEINKTNEISNDLIIMNQKIFEESELTWLISKANEADSIESSMIFKYINACLNLDNLDNNNGSEGNDILDKRSKLSKGIFFNWAFYEHINEIIVRETKAVAYLSNIDLDQNPILNTTKGINGVITYGNRVLKNKIMINSSIENILNIKEGLVLVIKSFPLMTQAYFDQYNSLITEIFINLVKYNAYITMIWKRWLCDNDNNHSLIKVIQTYVLTYYSFLQFVFDLSFDKDFAANIIINNSLLNPQQFYDICYEIVKLDSEKSEYNFQMKLMFSKVLPYLIEIQQLNKDKVVINVKNEGDTLIEVMTTLKTVYEIKIEVYDSKIISIFKIDNKNIKAKNDLLNAINSLVLTSQNCKVIFVKSKFMHSFIDYINQLTEILLSEKLVKQNAMDETANPQYLNYVMNEYINILMLFQNLLANYEPCDERDELFVKMKSGQIKKERFLKMLYDIFMDVIRYPLLFDNYLKILMNILSNRGDLAQYFLISINNTKDTLLSIILDYFTKHFNSLCSMPSFNMFIQSIKCLFQYRAIANSLQKGKFIEAIKAEITKIIINKKTFGNSKFQQFLEQLMLIFVSISFDKDYGRKLGNKEFVLNLSEVLLKTKNENLIYNIMFFYRNICFVNSNRITFMSNENLLGSVFALFNGELTGIKVKYMISHLLWVLLYNNQTLKAMLNREEFKGELRAMHIHLQKEVDMEKLGERKENEANRIYLHETCLNMRKIMNILEG